jgi:hypothetical protein
MSRGIAHRAGSYRRHGEFSEHKKTHDELLRERQSRDPFHGKTQIPRKAGESKNSWRRRVGLPVKVKTGSDGWKPSPKKKTFKPQPSVMVEIMTPCGCLVTAHKDSIQQRLNNLFDNGHKGKESKTVGKFDSDGDWSPYTKEDCEIYPMATWVNSKRCDPSHPRAYTACSAHKSTGYVHECEDCAQPTALVETSRSYDSYMQQMKSELQQMFVEREIPVRKDGSFNPPKSWSKAKLIDLLMAHDEQQQEEEE